MAKKKKVLTEFKKPCLKCSITLTIDNFYTNREWKSQYFRDAWCKKCVNDFVIDKDTLLIYFQNNKRVYKEKLWDWVTEYVDNFFTEDEEYNKMTDLIKKAQIYYTKFFKIIYQQMNRIQYYEFSYSKCDDELTDEGQVSEVDRFNANISDKSSLNYGMKSYSKIWLGDYTENEIAYLEEYFSGLQRDFKLENVAYINYARKWCKASLAMDKAFADYLDGKTGAERRYKDFKDVFEQLSQSAKFAERTRSENDAVGMGSFGELTKRLELDGYLQKEPEFDKDELDKVLDEYRWILASVGEEF
ncbi:MAG: hypothetical protein ACM3O3_12855 [Syntrophothermus sp.]